MPQSKSRNCHETVEFVSILARPYRRVVARIGNITFAAAEPVALAAFWAAATGYVPVELPPEVLEPIQREIDEGSSTRARGRCSSTRPAMGRGFSSSGARRATRAT